MEDKHIEVDFYSFVDFTGEENEKEFLEKCLKQWEITNGREISDINKLIELGTIFSEMRHRVYNRKVEILMENIKFAIEYLKNNSYKMVEKNNNYAVQTCNLAIKALEIQEKICEAISEIDRKYDNYDVMLVIEIKDILNELIID